PDQTGAAPGAAKTYTFTASRPGTYLYEAGHTADGARQATMGLVGALVVRAPARAGQPTAYGSATSAYDDEAVLVLTEVDPAFSTSADPLVFDKRSFHPTYRLINGKAFPETDPVATDVGRKVLLRYVNAGLDAHPMTTLGTDQWVAGEDARATSYPEGAVTVPLAPGKTIDAIASLPTGQDGRRFLVYESGGSLSNAGQTDGAVQTGISPQQAFGGMMTSLDTNPAPASGDHTGPVSAHLAVAPDPSTVTSPVTVTADFSDANGGNSPVDRAEVVVDNLGIAEGTGTPFTTGAFGAPTVTGATAQLSPAILQTLTQGRHTLWVRAHDTAGNWGVVSAATMTLAVTGAVTTGITATPNPSRGTGELAIGATGDDSALGGTVTGAEYFTDSTGASGNGQPLALNQPGAAIAAETATVPAATVAALAEGTHTILVHTKDSLGLWGPFASLTLTVDRTGPALLSGAVLPSVTDGTTGSPSDPDFLRVNAAFTDAAAGGVSSVLTAAEGFLDTPGASGNGLSFVPLDGAFDTRTENSYGLVPLSELTGLADGQHQLLVHAQDAAGNWGPLTAITFTVDRSGPVVSAVTGTNSAGSVTLHATATDSLTAVAGAEWYEGTDPGTGKAAAMTVTATGATTASLSAAAGAFANGSHTFWIRARDAAGNWGKAVSGTVPVTGSALIFADNFDTGTGRWSARTGSPQVAPSAAFGNSPALTITGRTPAYVVDNTPANEKVFGAQFGFAAGSLATRNATVDLFHARRSNAAPVLSVAYRRTTTGSSQLQLGVLTSAGWKYSAWTTIQPTAVTVGVSWSSGANATAVLSVNGHSAVTVTGNTSAYSIDSVAVGMVATSGTTTGAAALDNYTSHR
ncbi:MAG: Multicopper oxidase, partial [Actinomycetia bacterium]|nr:Multicopper oxidase [Actinomycetes bacterium]